MARQKTKRRDPARVEEWSVDEFPYMIVRKYVQHPKYVRSHKEAITYLSGLVKEFELDMARFDRDVPKACATALDLIGKISVDGGHVHVVLAPYTNTYFQAELVKRKPVGVGA